MLLFIIPKSAGLLSQVAIAEKLFEAGWDICLWMNFTKESIDDNYSQQLKIKPWKLIFEEDYKSTAMVTPISSKTSKLKKKIEQALPDANAKTFNALFDSYKKRVDIVETVIKEIAPMALIVSNDGIAGDMFITSAAKRLSIPVICCPYGFCGEADLENDIKIKIEGGRSNNITKPGGEIVKKLFPKWIKKGNYKNHLMYRPETILAWETLAVSVNHPWRVYGSDADIMCVPSQQYKDHLMAEGYNAKKISVIGSINGDNIWEQVRKFTDVASAFQKAKKIQADLTRVLLCMPPSYHATRSHLTSCPESYTDLINAITRPLLTNHKVALTVSVHPSVTVEDMASFEQLDITVVKGDVINLIPKHDIYISDFSSTILWAIASGKPTINYDFYNFDLDVYEDAAGVITVREHEEYENLLKKLIDDDDFFSQQANKQIAVSDSWGIIDGKFISQLIVILENRITKNRTSFIQHLNNFNIRNLIYRYTK